MVRTNCPQNDDTAAANMFDFWQVGITEPNRLAMAQRYTAI